MTTQTELTTLERRLAEREARCSIESYCMPAAGGWFDTANCDPDTADEVAEGARYLELRGLLERREGGQNVVRVKEGSRSKALELMDAMSAAQKNYDGYPCTNTAAFQALRQEVERMEGCLTTALDLLCCGYIGTERWVIELDDLLTVADKENS